MKDRESTQVLENGAVRYAVYNANGTLLRYDYLLLADEPTEPGTTLNSENLLSDEAASAVGVSGDSAVPSDAFVALGTGKQNKPIVVSSGSSITLANNTQYVLLNATTLTFSAPTGDYGAWGVVGTADSGDIVITLPAGAEYLGDAPVFGNGQTWEFSVWNNRWVWAQAEVG